MLASHSASWCGYMECITLTGVLTCRVHFALIMLYNCWVMWVLFTHYKEFVIVRQHYLVRGELAWVGSSAEPGYAVLSLLCIAVSQVHDCFGCCASHARVDVCCFAGDDPNYWIQATRQAETEYMTQKVRQILAEYNGKQHKKVSLQAGTQVVQEHRTCFCYKCAHVWSQTSAQCSTTG